MKIVDKTAQIRGYESVHMLTKTKDIELATTAAEKVVEIHRRLAAWLRAGLTLAQIDAFVAKSLADLDSKSAFFKYRTKDCPAFPSHACLSPNEVVVHGTAGMTTKPVETGEVLSIDIGVKYRGWIGDAAWTYIIGEPRDDESVRLCECGIESLKRGVEQLRPGRMLIEWARAVQTCVEDEYGYHLMQGLGGHGYGRTLHAPPYVSNTVPNNAREWPEATMIIQPGLLVAVEPMVAVGTGHSKQKSRQWPIRTADGSLSVHYEHDVLVTESGPQVLTKGLEELPMIVG